ncbi:hypothetical protein ZWY2020_044247 [Hordeum vulgare]|nr:hypothetical protein ZWY2020_044247 [Hordeum vulgare]
MTAISTAHAGRTLYEPGVPDEYRAGSTLVGSNTGKWPYGVDSLDLGSIKEAAGGPAAAAEPEGGFAFVHVKIWDHVIKCYKKVISPRDIVIFQFPSEKRAASYPKNLSVESYWKGQSASKRALNFGSSSCGEKLPVAGIDNNNSAMPMDGLVVKVATAGVA